MVAYRLPKTLPDCQLLTVLAAKVQERHDTDFDFFGTLEAFRQKVSGEVRQINQLFPEYTPHEEQYHLKRLFHVADTLLGKEKLEAMTSAELFVLAVALYGHDWGMAVSGPEKEYIVNGKPAEGMSESDLWILADERDRFSKFLRDHRLIEDPNSYLKDIPIGLWREYVRQTHALRGAERVRRFFAPIDGGVAEGASRVCVGHWLDFEDLEDYRSYPPDFSVLREIVNLRAITIYLRLIDLLDVAEDRTPYVIWKFIAPRDPRSRMEWAKHRALRPITCPPYQEGRIIRVDGSTDDHEVYAALEDLRIYCEQQLRNSNDVLWRMNDPRHKLDIYHIDWRVAARGFDPISVRFEFDRERMFEILSDEIYQSDPYVFLRELLQNSIDAIRMRREILERKGIPPGDLGTIQVIVEHGKDGDAKITWRDDGIGMDEYIVRNYLAVAGKSYYSSADFERESLKMDPISKFGVGLLSCFMVADCIDIETFKEPYLPPTGKPLRIKIPAIRRQFRIETLAQDSLPVGTTVRVYVDGKTLPSDGNNKPPKPLDVTAYLQIVAGFVEFPIVIAEGDRRTIVLHPKRDPESARKRFGVNFHVHQIDLGYPWWDIILPQDLPTAREILREDRVDLSTDLNLTGYEGALSYLVPVNETIDFKHSYFSDVQGFEAMVRGQQHASNQMVRWKEERTFAEVSRSADRSAGYAVYRDGILLARASDPTEREGPFQPGPRGLPRYLVTNLPKSRAPRVDLARTQILGHAERWDLPIKEALLHRLSETFGKDLLALDPSERFYQLGRLIAFHRIGYLGIERLGKILPCEHWPLPFLESGGRISYREGKEIKGETIYLVPNEFEYELGEILDCQWIEQKPYDGHLSHWTGAKCLLLDYTGTSVAITATRFLTRSLLERSFHLSAARFLQPPYDNSPPLVQRIWTPKNIGEEPAKIEALLEKAAENPAVLTAAECEFFYKTRPGRSFEPVAFLHPFDRTFAYGTRLLNLKHTLTQALIQCVARLELSKRHKTLPAASIGQLEDALNSVSPSIQSESRRVFDLAEISPALTHLWRLAKQIKLLELEEEENLVPTADELLTSWEHFVDLYSPLTRKENIRPFGQPITVLPQKADSGGV